jgi:hypothetical protein
MNEAVFDCETCHDTGAICAACRQPDGECKCTDAPDLIACPECDGEGLDGA